MLKKISLITFPLLIVSFSLWLMFHTFALSSSLDQLIIASKAWSDFGSHIPLIRSFSVGSNWPPEYPLFPGSPIQYHYLFYAVTGWLENLGIRLDFAFNIISGLGLASLVCLIFVAASKIFRSSLTGLLSGLFFLFNGSFSFTDYFAKLPFSLQSLLGIVQAKNFASFGPWSGGLITAFWNLNIYTNQRHLGLSFAVLLLLLYALLNSRRLVYFSGFLLGSLLLLNQAAFLIGVVFFVWIFIFKYRSINLLAALVIGLAPWLVIALNTIAVRPQIEYQIGYLIPRPVTLMSFLNFWFFNFGFHSILIPIGMIFSLKSARILIFPTLTIFVLANLFRFSPDMINNHKFFNFFLILGSMYTAYLLTRIFQIKIFGPVLTLTLTLTLILGGIVDLFPIINDHKILIADTGSNPDSNFFLTQISRRSVVLNSYWFYHPASLAGRSIFNGYSYFTWSYGYDQVARESQTIAIYSAPTKVLACKLLLASGIDYVELSPNHENFIPSNPILWAEFVPLYSNTQTGLTVYSVSQNCPQL